MNTPQPAMDAADRLMHDKWAEMQSNLARAEATGLHGIPEILATINATRPRCPPVEASPRARLAAALIANRDHTAATVEPIAVVDFYPAPKDDHEHH